MKLKELQDAMIAAMKAKDKFRKDAISALVSAVKKKGIDNGCREMCIRDRTTATKAMIPPQIRYIGTLFNWLKIDMSLPPSESL